jgi:hypothetical protein
MGRKKPPNDRLVDFMAKSARGGEVSDDAEDADVLMKLMLNSCCAGSELEACTDPALLRLN